MIVKLLQLLTLVNVFIVLYFDVFSAAIGLYKAHFSRLLFEGKTHSNIHTFPTCQLLNLNYNQ